METHKLKNTDTREVDLFVDQIDHTNPYDSSVTHRHNYFEILLFENGNGGSQIIDFVEHPIQAHCLYIVAPNQVHLVKRKKSENGMVLQFTKSFLQDSLSSVQIDWLFALRTSPKVKLSSEQFSFLYSIFTQLKELYSSSNKYKAFQLRHHFALLIMHILEVLPKESVITNNESVAFHFMNLAEEKFKEVRSVSAYAKLLLVSLNKLNQEVKDKFGKTPLQIIHELLVVEIKRLIVVEGLSSKEITYRLHFDSQSSYSRFVRKHCGVSPSDLKGKLHDG